MSVVPLLVPISVSGFVGGGIVLLVHAVASPCTVLYVGYTGQADSGGISGTWMDTWAFGLHLSYTLHFLVYPYLVRVPWILWRGEPTSSWIRLYELGEAVAAVRGYQNLPFH